MSDLFLKKLRSLRTLAESGIGGEQRNARELFERLCKKHGIDPSQIESTEELVVWMKFSGKSEFNILCQCARFVLKRSVIDVYTGYLKSGKAAFRMNASQELHFKELWDHYRREWRKVIKLEIAKTEDAFINKHDLFSGEAGGQSDPDLDIDDLLRRIRALDSKSHVYRLKLEGGVL